MTNVYLKPTVVDINNLRIFLYLMENPLDMTTYFLRISEAFNFECFFEDKAKLITAEDFSNWSLMLEKENPYESSYYGLFMQDFHLTGFYPLFKDNLSKEEKSVLKSLEQFECFETDGKKFRKLRKFAIIAINKITCKENGVSAETTLIHEMSHALYCANKSYKTFVNRIYERTGVAYQEIMQTQLTNRYNSADRIEDEWAAYLLDNSLKLSKFNKYADIDVSRVNAFFENLVWSHSTIVDGPKNNLLQKYISKIGQKK